MDYAIVFTPRAAEEFAALPVDLALVIDGFLERLAADPAAHSSKPYFPFRPGGLMSELKQEFPGRTSYVRIFFHFGAGENTLILTGLVVQTIAH
jgi:hypothetical protein